MTAETKPKAFVAPNHMTHDEAIKWVYERYKKLATDRRLIASRFKDVITDAHAAGYTPATMRLSARLDAMTPDARATWVSTVKAATVVFRSTALDIDLSASTRERDPDLWGYLEKAKHLRRERLALTGAMKDLAEIAAENGVDMHAIKEVLKIQARVERADPEKDVTASGLFDTLDQVGRAIGVWA